jgi:hypothetical protein
MSRLPRIARPPSDVRISSPQAIDAQVARMERAVAEALAKPRTTRERGDRP